MVHPSSIKDIEKCITEETNTLRKELKADSAPRTEQNIIRRKLATLTRDPSNGFVSIGTADEGSIYMDPKSYESRRSAYKQLLNQQRADMRHAWEVSLFPAKYDDLSRRRV